MPWTLLFLLGLAQVPSEAPAPQVPAPRPPAAAVAWFPGSFEELGARARAEQRAVLVVLESPASRWCARFDADALRDPELPAALGGALAWRTDAASEAGTQLAGRFGAADTPVTLFFDAGGRAVERLDGYRTREVFRVEVARALRGEDTAPDLAARVAREPEDLDLRTRYACKLELLGDFAGRNRQVEELRRRDRARTSLPLRRDVYAERLAKIQEHYERTREINPGPLVRFLEEERHPELRFEGLLALAAMHRQRVEELAAAQQTLAAAAKRSDLRRVLAAAETCLPANAPLQLAFALETVATFASTPRELAPEERALAVRLASRAILLAPDEGRVHAAAAVAAQLSGDKIGAALALRRALELEPEAQEWRTLAQSLGL